MIGDRHGQLVVINEFTNWRGTRVLVRCDCGTERTLKGIELLRGRKSCGCGKRVNTRQQPLYHIWRGIRRRCHSPGEKDYPRYGGRGIRVCERWHNFAAFRADMEPTWQPGLTIERIDNDADYSPSNCRWATYKEQNRNKWNNIIVDSPWGRITIAEAAERSGINYYTLWSRWQTGKPLFGAKSRGFAEVKHIVDTPWGRLSLADAARISGVNYFTLWSRLKSGGDLF